MSIESIPFQELTVETFLIGSFDTVVTKNVHGKTCPYTILAQAEQGQYEVTCGEGRHVKLASGEAFLTGANVPLRIVHHGDVEAGYRMRARWIHLHVTLFGIVDATSLLGLPLRVTAQQFEPFGEIIAFLVGMGVQDGGSFGALAQRNEFGFRAFRLLCERFPLRPDAMEVLRQRNRLGPVLHLMRDRLAEKITVADLARAASLSVSQFYVFFRRYARSSPMDYLKHLRLSEACRLLATGDEPIRYIAEKTGFCSEFHLSREFTGAYGNPPGRWRANCKLNGSVF